jgi:hypothetical protein
MCDAFSLVVGSIDVVDDLGLWEFPFGDEESFDGLGINEILGCSAIN